MKTKLLLLLSLSLSQSFAFAATVDCYNLLSTLPARGYNLSIAQKSGFLFAANRGDKRGFYVVGKTSVRWVSIPPKEFTSWKTILVPGIDNLTVSANYTNSESYLTMDDENQKSQHTEKQLKSGNFLKLKAEDIQQNDKDYKTALHKNLSDRFESLLLSEFSASKVNKLKTEQIETIPPTERTYLIRQLEFSSNDSIERVIEACQGEGISEEHISQLKKIKPTLVSAYNKIKVKQSQPPPRKNETGIK